MNNKKKYAVVTINIGTRFADMGALTIPYMKNYAEKIGVDFVPIEKIIRKHESQYSAYWAKFQLYDLLDQYERVLFLDLDALVYPHCPDIFEVVPEDRLGVLVETDYSHDKTEEIMEIQSRIPDINWRKDYFNVGVMVVSSAHREVFNIKHGDQGGKKFPEQTQINYNVQRFKIPLFRLDHTFNHIYLCGNLNLRAQSNIFHYAGIDHQVRTALIQEDIKRYYAGKMPVQLEEFVPFFENHFPGKDMRETLMKYTLYKDSEILER